jgi:4-diphosphocytidyl-2-C-methyl-D-erythritol kinase
MKWPAPAKLNLFLHVCRRRLDGYHELQTLFQLIDWCDELEIQATSDGLITRVGGLADVPHEQDLVIRAARLLQTASGTSAGATIHLHKNIPVGAGLGGGSSDAATTLLVLNHLWQCDLSITQLAELGLSLGADVPLFIYGNSAFARGVGEQLEAVELGDRHYVLVFMPLHISTAEVFRHPDLQRDCELISKGDVLAGAGQNVCEEVVRNMYPIMARALDDLRRYGAARMTGTGSSIFVEMPDADAAIRTTSQLNSLYNVRAVRGLDRSPVHEMLRNTGLC